MTNKIFERTIRLIGSEKFSKLQNTSILLAGVGGVGSYVAEALVRSGIGQIIIVDKDIIEISNLNRQLHALQSTIGKPKVEVMKNRLLDINPGLKVVALKEEVSQGFLTKLSEMYNFDYIIDAIDDVSAKIDLVVFGKRNEIPIIMSMGTANKVDNQAFKIADISKTKICPLARKMRYELKKHHIRSGLKVLYSEASAQKSSDILGTISFVPGTAGLLIAGEVVKDLIKDADV